jgi:hypothetical protein
VSFKKEQVCDVSSEYEVIPQDASITSDQADLVSSLFVSVLGRIQDSGMGVEVSFVSKPKYNTGFFLAFAAKYFA